MTVHLLRNMAEFLMKAKIAKKRVRRNISEVLICFHEICLV